MGQLSFVSQLPALYIAHSESLVDRYLCPNIHSQAWITTLDHAHVHLLGRNPFTGHHHSAHIRLAPLHFDAARPIPTLVLRSAAFYLPHQLSDWFCHLPRVGFHGRTPADWSGNCAMAADY